MEKAIMDLNEANAYLRLLQTGEDVPLAIQREGGAQTEPVGKRVSRQAARKISHRHVRALACARGAK
ncbi:hypothetical protein [Desulfatibacillum aliphaticivorans]|uniref:hypothetical protein n=1 Tax=Desulfatibacillum aliphaticivorans TaxID=218208 RepID=UPI00041FD379|nr:hypothetical protein [Desulfatibacillum aliphaticivorans]